jgi:hypothetical protein
MGPVAVVATVTMTTRVSSSSFRGIEPSPKKAHFGVLLGVSSRYVCEAA